ASRPWSRAGKQGSGRLRPPGEYHETVRHEGPLMSMYVARLQFGRPRRQHRDAADLAVNGYLAELVKNGQACEYFLTEKDSSFQAFVEMPASDALEPRFFSRQVSQELKAVVETFGREPRIQRSPTMSTKSACGTTKLLLRSSLC